MEPQAGPRPALALASGPHLSPRDHSKHQLNQWFSCFWHHFGVQLTIPNHPKAKETNGFLAFCMISSSFPSPPTSQKGNETNGFLAFGVILESNRPFQITERLRKPMGFLPFGRFPHRITHLGPPEKAMKPKVFLLLESFQRTLQPSQNAHNAIKQLFLAF